jgi:peptidoglycan/LPS O-acetylase OafA/YrhL
MAHKRTIQSLQAGRGLAALAVAMLHSSLAAHEFGGSFGPYSVLQFGYLGVDFFFVLSGFIIYHSTVGRDRSVADYALARFRRVYLPYWPVGIAIALLYLALPGVSEGHRDWSWLPTLTLAPVDAEPALSVAWTLKHEILFYVLFGLFYYGRMLWLGLAVWAIGIVLARTHIAFALVNLEFFFGIIAAMLYRTERAPWPMLLLAPFPAILWAAMGADDSHRVLIGAMFALIVAPVAQLERKGRFNVPAPLVLLGAASYSLYLVHEPLVSVAARLLSGSWPIFAAAMAAALAGGFAYHFVIEQRAIRKRTNPEVFAGGLGEADQTSDQSAADAPSTPSGSARKGPKADSSEKSLV